MSQSELTNLLHDPRLAPHAVSALPVWLWSVDGTRVLWANAVAAAIFGARSPAALSQQTFDASNTAATQMARVGATLSDGGAVRLERLRGFGAGFGRALTCQCSRLALADATGAVLVAAAERAGPDLSLDERARRLLDGIDTPFAVFAEDGRLIHATPAALERIGVATDLIALGAEALGTQARESGEAQDDVSAGHLSVRRLGSGTATVLLARVEDAATTQAPALEAPAAEAAPASELQPETKASAPAPETAPPVVPEPAIVTQAERKHPLRFVWQMDEAGAFTIASDEFVQLIGPKTAAMLGHPWSKISAALDIDTDGAIAKALSSRDTWSGIVLPWPVDGSDERLPIELSGLPVFDRDRSFRGYRGFGVCRDTERLSALAIARSLAPPEPLAPEPPAMPSKPTPAPDDFATTDLPAEPTLPLAENVVPFRPPVVAEKPAAKEHQNGEAAPALTPIESTAFSEIGRRLTDRLQAGPHTVSNRGPEPLEAEQQPAARTRGEIRPETE